MHHTTLTMLRTLADLDRSGALSDCYLVRHSEDAPLDLAVHAWSEADYPDADPEPEAARATSLDALAEAVGPLETSPLAGGADLRAELEAARADHLADVQARAAENDDLRARLQAMHRRAQKAEEEATRLGRWTLDLRAEIDTLAQRLGEREAELRIAREEAARPRLRDRLWRWVGVPRG